MEQGRLLPFVQTLGKVCPCFLSFYKGKSFGSAFTFLAYVIESGMN